MMRRKDREITNREEIEAILSQAPVCRLALNTGDGAPYIVPLCCGCEWLPNGRLRLVFHSAPGGAQAAADPGRSPRGLRAGRGLRAASRRYRLPL